MAPGELEVGTTSQSLFWLIGQLNLFLVWEANILVVRWQKAILDPDHKMATLYFCLALPLSDTILHVLQVDFSTVHEAVQH